jgi:hypothetical protein
MSGCTCRAPKLITGCGAAASTHRRAAVAQPVDWESMPSIAVSYSANARYRARMRRTTSLGVTRSPSSIASTMAPGSWASTWPSRLVASPIPHRTESSRQKTSMVTTGSSPSLSRMLFARAK